MKTILTYLGVAVAAVAASACCWIPALLGAGAAGSLGISAALAPWRPHLLALTGLFLIAGFWMAYRKPKADCYDSGGCATPAAAKRRKINIGLMWIVAAFAVAMSAYPNFLAASASAGTGSSPAASVPAEATLVFKVEGMDCEACAAPIKTEVEKVPGVQSASIDFAAKKLTVTERRNGPDSDVIIEAVRTAGFQATLSGDSKQ